MQTAKPVEKKRRLARLVLTCSFGMLVAGPELASAVVKITPEVDANVVYYSNVFNLPDFDRGMERWGGDTAESYVASLAAKYSTGQNSVDLHGAARHFEYNHFTFLSHNEYAAGVDVDWHFGPILETLLTYNFSRAMAPFADTLATDLVLTTDKAGEATFRVMLTPEWRFEFGPRIHDLLTPLPAFGALPAYPDFMLREKGGAATLNFLGVAHVTAGLTANYMKGAYSGINGATKYRQITGGLTATYTISAMSSFDGALGYTARDTSPNPEGSLGSPIQGQINPYFGADVIGRDATVTGNLNYNRQLSPKTSFQVGLFRQVSSYMVGANATVGTGLQLGVNWQADFRFQLAATLRAEQQQFLGTEQLTNGDLDRKDHLYAGQFSVTYMVNRWVNVATRFGIDRRTSNFNLAAYSGWTAALELTARRP